MESLVLNIVRKIEELTGSIAFGEYNESFPKSLWIVYCSDYDYYMKDRQFQNYIKVWKKMASKHGEKLVFAYCNPSVNLLEDLANKGNLILNL